MKKFLFFLAVLVSFLEARFYWGLEAGGTYTQYLENQDILNKDNKGVRGSVYGAYIGGNFGTEHYFARDSMLFRWFISGGGDVLAGYGDLNLGIDFMGTLYKTESSAFGIFLGVEMSTSFVGGDADFGGHFRVGMSTLFASHYRLELYYRLLLGDFSDHKEIWVSNFGYLNYYRHYQRSDAVILAYKYVF